MKLLFENWRGYLNDESETSVFMDPDTFLRLAGSSLEVLTPSQVEKHTSILDREGELEQPLFLELEGNEDGSVSVISHDGRHRSRAAALKGHAYVPVVLGGTPDILQAIKQRQITHLWSQYYDDEEVEEGYLPEASVLLNLKTKGGREL